MYLDEIRDLCLSFPHVEECQPFSPDHVVYKKNGKIFLMVGLTEFPIRIAVKCDPELAVSLRADYPNAILPGWHMNKKHWNTVLVDGLPRTLIEDQIKQSYLLVK